MSTEKQASTQISKELADKLEELNTLIKGLPFDIQTYPQRENWPSLESTLREAGWYPERSIDISPFLSNKNPHANKINTIAAEFIAKLNNLSIKFPLNKKESTYTYHFNAESAMRNYHIDTRKNDEKLLKTKLCPVGISEDGYIVLLIAETGQVFASVDTNLEFVANSYQEALEKLNRNEPFQPIEQ
jgi:hypothetical protein